LIERIPLSLVVRLRRRAHRPARHSVRAPGRRWRGQREQVTIGA